MYNIIDDNNDTGRTVLPENEFLLLAVVTINYIRYCFC